PHPGVGAVVQRVLGDQIDDSGRDEESRRDHLHPTESGPPFGVVRRVARLQGGRAPGDDGVERQSASRRPSLRKPIMQVTSPARNTTAVATTAAMTSPSETPMSST